ncbi:MAG TPA: TetR/AcrR family transcriptional regulator [Bacillota bacterium]|nr:TetR/AcrR family transcriptional regulator [Bacillota bacterium]
MYLSIDKGKKYIYYIEYKFNERKFNMTTREEQKEKRKAEILDTALDLFICKGYAATKISDIARRAGMSVGLMFHYFKSKEKLYEELIKIGISGPMGVMAQSNTEPFLFFKNSAEFILGLVKAEPFAAKMFVLMSQAYYSEATPKSIKDMLSGFDIYGQTVALIEQGQRNGTIREGNPLALAIAYWSAIQGIAGQLALNPSLPCPESRWIIDILRRRPE